MTVLFNFIAEQGLGQIISLLPVLTLRAALYLCCWCHRSTASMRVKWPMAVPSRSRQGT